jgi:hypothetical protein
MGLIVGLKLPLKCGRISTQKSARWREAVRAQRLCVVNILGNNQYCEYYDIGNEQYSSTDLSYCPISGSSVSVTSLTQASGEWPQASCWGEGSPSHSQCQTGDPQSPEARERRARDPHPFAPSHARDADGTSGRRAPGTGRATAHPFAFFHTFHLFTRTLCQGNTSLVLVVCRGRTYSVAKA